MNLNTGLIAILFFVGLGAVVVAQRLQIRSAQYETGVLDRQLREAEEQERVLRVQLTRERDPQALFRRAREMEIPVRPPEETAPQVDAKGAKKG